MEYTFPKGWSILLNEETCKAYYDFFKEIAEKQTNISNSLFKISIYSDQVYIQSNEFTKYNTENLQDAIDNRLSMRTIVDDTIHLLTGIIKYAIDYEKKFNEFISPDYTEYIFSVNGYTKNLECFKDISIMKIIETDDLHFAGKHFPMVKIIHPKISSDKALNIINLNSDPKIKDIIYQRSLDRPFVDGFIISDLIYSNEKNNKITIRKPHNLDKFKKAANNFEIVKHLGRHGTSKKDIKESPKTSMPNNEAEHIINGMIDCYVEAIKNNNQNDTNKL